MNKVKFPKENRDTRSALGHYFFVLTPSAMSIYQDCFDRFTLPFDHIQSFIENIYYD